MDHLLESGIGKDFNVVIAIERPCVEVPEATRIIDALAHRFEMKSTMENANAIWPSFFARPGREATHVFADIERFAVRAIKSACRNRHDSYVERLVAWRSKESGQPVPQLQNILTRLQSEVGKRAPKSSSYEIAIYSPGLDAAYMSFPCLSYLSFKYDRSLGQIHLTALYRNHTFLSHAYGNFVGLGRLIEFVCRQTGTTPGELVSISSHADAEIVGGRKTHVRDAVKQVRKVLQCHAVQADRSACGDKRRVAEV
jgi:thymidylate synthase